MSIPLNMSRDDIKIVKFEIRNSGKYANDFGTSAGSGSLSSSKLLTSSVLATWTSHDAVAMWNLRHMSVRRCSVTTALMFKYQQISEIYK